jgi:dolichol-phosphate mannosyltransferase
MHHSAGHRSFHHLPRYCDVKKGLPQMAHTVGGVARASALTVVIPTFNERDNIEPLLAALQTALRGIPTEVLFVDDSNDDTPAIIQAASARLSSRRFVITLLHRPEGPARADGLAGAVQLGLAQARATYVAVIDADLQHPPQKLRLLYQRAVKHDADVVMATRYRPGGSYEGLDGMHRRFISVGLKWVAKSVFPDQLLRVSDPLGGFFLLRRSLLQGVTLRPVGYKISLELLIRCRWSKLVEVPYQFQARNAGASKSDFKQGMMVLRHMARLVREVPAGARFWKFCLVGATGAIINLLLLAFALGHHWSVVLGWLFATEVSILANFVFHHLLTWRDLTRTGWGQRLAHYHGTVALGTLCTFALFTGCNALIHSPLVSQCVALAGGTLINYWLATHITFTTLPLRLGLPQWRARRGFSEGALGSKATVAP